jgi:zinc transporter ZupT
LEFKISRGYRSINAIESRRIIFVKKFLVWAAICGGWALCRVIGAASVIFAEPLLSYALGFAAGVMIFVVV